MKRYVGVGHDAKLKHLLRAVYFFFCSSSSSALEASDRREGRQAPDCARIHTPCIHWPAADERNGFALAGRASRTLPRPCMNEWVIGVERESLPGQHYASGGIADAA